MPNLDHSNLNYCNGHLDHGGTLEQFLEWYEGVTRAQLEAAQEIRLAAAA